MAVKMTKPRTIVRGFRTYSSKIGDLLLALLLLTGLLLPALLLLATLTGLWLTTLLLLATLLTGFLVWILIHSFFLSNIACHVDRSFSMAGVNPRQTHSFPPFILKQMRLELAPMCRVPLLQGEPRGTAICFCGCLEC